MNDQIISQKDGYLLRLAKKEDADAYYSQNFCPMDPETAYLTQSGESFTEEEVIRFFLRSADDADRVFFLIVDPHGKIVGESIINEIDRELRCANFRIALFQKTVRGKGIGTWATRVTRDYAFETLKLHRLELDVYSFNPGAEAVYRKAGFRREGVLRDAVLANGRYADDILMAILEDEWKEIKNIQQ